MASSVTLSAATRQNLLSLQDTAALASTNQNRLSTGKKVNTALDNPTNYFTASALSDRSSALTGLLDGISNGIQTIQAASKGVDTVTSLVKQMQSVVAQAQTNAATNLPKIASNAALANSTETAATGKSAHDVTLGKTLQGAVGAATASTPGIVGVDATKADTLQIKAGNNTYTYSIGTTDTVNDIVNQINKSGIATASVDSQGQVQVVGSASDPLSVNLGKVTSGAFAPDAGETAKLLGSGSTSGVPGGGTSAARSALIDQFNNLRTQLDQAAKDASFNGTNLLAGDKMSIAFNEKTGSAQSKLDIQGATITSLNLGVGTMADSSTTANGSNFSIQNNGDLSKASDALTNALSTLRSTNATLGSNLSVVQTRQDFTKNLINVLDTGSSNLTNADMNEEAANSQALSTRQSLGISALSLANTAQQGILQLLR